MAGHQVIGVFPALKAGDIVEPAVDVGPLLAVKTEGLGVVEVAAAGNVGIGDAIAHDPVAPLQMFVQHRIGGLQTALHEGDDLLRTFVFGQEVHQEPGHASLAGQFVIVPQHPAQHIVFLGVAAAKLAGFGIELLDVRFKRINYNETVRRRIYERMVSERQQIAARFRSEGAGEAAKIIGKKERDLQEIESESYKRVQEIYGEADAKASAIYAEAYDSSPASAELYKFIKTLETYRDVLSSDVSLVLTTDSPLFRLLKVTDFSDAFSD